jgi:hypothetical protein
MRSRLQFVMCVLLVGSCARFAPAQESGLRIPNKLEAGSAFSIPTSGSGKAVLYIVGPSQVLRRPVNLGEAIAFEAGDLHSAGHYTALLVGSDSNQQTQFDVVAAHEPTTLGFLAKPSRLPVSRQNGISGVAYIFDRYRNLVLQPTPVSFQLSVAEGSTQKQTATSRDGVAWVRMNSASRAGSAQFQATAGSVTEKRIIQQVAGEPCKLRMSAQPTGPRVILQTEPVRDCSGNAVPDGTVVSFTSSYQGRESTVDVPLKRSIARAEIPMREGAVVSVATGVVLGNEIRLGGK